MTSKEYDEYLNSAAWDELRIAALEEAYYECEECGASDCVLHVHHLTYERIFRECMDDLEVLCEDCHEDKH